MQPTYIYNAVITKIVDADTVDMLVDLGLRVNTAIRVRLYGVNAPEMNTDAGKLAKLALIQLMPVGSVVIVRTFKDPTDKFGRWLGSIEFKGVDMSHWLVDNGHAVKMEM